MPGDLIGQVAHVAANERMTSARMTVWFWLAVVLQLGAGFVYLVSGLVVPGVALMLLWAIWLGLSFVLWRMRMRGSLALIVPAVAAGVWFAYLNIGAQLFGWTA